jgi:hypothetical protein
MFLGFFICWLIDIGLDLPPLAFASCGFLWIGVLIIVLNLRFTLIKFQFESVEFCYLIFSAIFTFVVASSLRDWDLSFTLIRFTYYTTFIFIILFDCLEDKFRRTSKWVLFIGGLSFAINAIQIQFMSAAALEEEGFIIRTYQLGKDSDSWTNLATYCRMNFVQSFFCFKMFYHLHYNVDYSYFITERRRNENFKQFSLQQKVDMYAANTFRSYAAFMEKVERQRSRSSKIAKSVRVISPSEENIDMPEPISEGDLERQKSDPTRIAVKILGSERFSNTRQSLTVTVTNQENISETILSVTPVVESEKEQRVVTFNVDEKTDTAHTNESEMYGAWIPRKNLIKFFNFCAISTLVLHIIALIVPMVIWTILTDFCIIALGSIVFLNLKFEYYRLIVFDVEYVYLMLSCAVAFYFHCDIHGWAPVRIFRNTYTWLAFAAFAHFDLLVNEMKRTLKYVLGFMVLSIWLLYANYLLTDQETLEEYYTIKSYNISENDQYTNLELWTRISMVMSFFWLKLAYHLWYYFEYFYYNRLLIKLDSFLDTSTIAPTSPTQDKSNSITPSQTPQSIISVTPDQQLTE